MKQLVRRVAGLLFILLSLIAFMFLCPMLYAALGKVISLLLLVLWIFVCSAVFEYIAGNSEPRDER